MICDHDVAWPWPCGEEPVMTVTLPNGCMRTVDDSQPGAEMPIAFVTADGARPQTSTYDERPMPRYRPRLRASSRRDSKLA